MRIFATTTLVLAVIGLGAVEVGLAQQPADDHVPGRLLVQSADSASDTDVEQVVALVGAKIHHKIDQIRVSVLEVPEQALEAVSQALTRTGRFTFVERDHIAHVSTTPNDLNFASQWHLTTIQAPSAWSITTGSSGVPIAIIDSGADSLHPDLAPKLISGWNFLTGTSKTSDTGCNTGHGTAVSGAAAAATNNLIGVAGVGWSNPIMPLVVMSSSCNGLYSDIASAISYAADHSVRIINISSGGTSASSTLQSAVDYAWNKGAVIFAAAGNSSSSTPQYPAACNNAVAVGATVSGDTLASFSNYGSWVDLTAPGDMILTTQMGGSYGYWYGTSLASPIAAAVGALALSANPSLSAAALVSLLEKNTDDLGAAGFDIYYGWGRVNAYKAVTAAKGGTADTTLPQVSISSPLPSVSVAGTIAVTGTASDNVGVTKVEFYVDGVLTSTGTATLFSFSWNSMTKANGSHTLMVKAYDAANNTRSASVTVSVSNTDTTLPTVAISSPLAGATVSGTAVVVTGTASDNIGVTKVEFYVDGVLTSTGTTASFSFSWNSTTKANGSHTLMVKAYDAANNTRSASVTVSVSNTDTTLPTVAISSPLAGATVSGTAVAVTGTASDNIGVTRVEFYVDSVLTSSGTAASFSFSWNSTTKANGSHTLMVKAYDATNNSGSASASVNVSNTTNNATVQPVLQIHGDATEVSGRTNGSTVTPGIAPAGFTGKVVVNGTGSVNFTPAQTGNGVYFLNCCANTNNAYYKFTGATVGNIFNVNQGKITFYLKSRYSFPQRQTSAASPRYAFDVRDGSNGHLFYFLTQVTSGRLQFTYAADGAAQYYYVPQGTEDTLFGNGVTLKVALTWNGTVENLYLNDTLVKSTPYTARAANWTATSNFDLGAYEYLIYGGYSSSDDIIDEFLVN